MNENLRMMMELVREGFTPQQARQMIEEVRKLENSPPLVARGAPSRHSEATKPSRLGYYLTLPTGHCWLTGFNDLRKPEPTYTLGKLRQLWKLNTNVMSAIDKVKTDEPIKVEYVGPGGTDIDKLRETLKTKKGTKYFIHTKPLLK